MTRYILVFILFLILITGCGKKTTIQEAINDDLTVINSDNIQDINALLWGDDISKNSNIADTADDTVTNSENANGIITTLLSRGEVDLVSIDNEKAVFNISAPDMSGFFEVVQEDVKSLSDDELSTRMIEYAKTTKIRTNKVTVAVEEEDNRLKPNYQEYKFINALTGGLLEEYANYMESILVQ